MVFILYKMARELNTFGSHCVEASTKHLVRASEAQTRAHRTHAIINVPLLNTSVHGTSSAAVRTSSHKTRGAFYRSQPM